MQRSGVATRWLCGALAGALVAFAVTGCEEERPAPDPGFQYAALGDSFTAAPDLPTTTTDGCHRSDHNYPHLVAKRLDDVTLTDVSCGGARTDAVLQSQVQQAESRVQVPQIDAVTAGTDLVTIGLGANDLDFVVAAAYGCLLMSEADPDGNPCEEVNGPKVPRLLDKIQDRLVGVVDAVRNRAPDARILLVGYPRLLEGSKGCPRVFPLARGDVDFVRTSWDRLNETVAAAAAEGEVEYVDVDAASEGHGVCADEPWINGKRADRATGAAAYHPTPEGQAGVAALLLDLIGRDGTADAPR